jgi:hypothetical protein
MMAMRRCPICCSPAHRREINRLRRLQPLYKQH